MLTGLWRHLWSCNRENTTRHRVSVSIMTMHVRMQEICPCFNREGWKTKTCLEKEKWHVKNVNASEYANTSTVKDERWESKKKVRVHQICQCLHRETWNRHRKKVPTSAPPSVMCGASTKKNARICRGSWRPRWKKVLPSASTWPCRTDRRPTT